MCHGVDNRVPFHMNIVLLKTLNITTFLWKSNSVVLPSLFTVFIFVDFTLGWLSVQRLHLPVHSGLPCCSRNPLQSPMWHPSSRMLWPQVLSQPWQITNKAYSITYSTSQEICTRFCCALLCCGYAIVHNEFTWSIYPYSSGLLCWHWGNR